METYLMIIVFTLIIGSIIKNALSDSFFDLMYCKLSTTISFNSVSGFYFDNVLPAVLILNIIIKSGYGLLDSFTLYSGYYLTEKVLLNILPSILLIWVSYKLPVITNYLVWVYDNWKFRYKKSVLMGSFFICVGVFVFDFVYWLAWN